MKSKLKLFGSIILYLVSIIFLVYYGISEINIVNRLTEMGRVFILCSSCLCVYIGSILLSKYLKNNKPMKISLWLFFIMYIILLITLTMFDKSWGRNGIVFINWSNELFNNYIKTSFNLIPFHTITNYIKMFNSLYSTQTVLFNLIGNFVALMPMAFFLRLLFNKQNNFKTFIITILLIVIGIELFQFLTLSGSCDIDDIILNTSGALIIYIIMSIKSVNNLLKNIFLLEHNKIEKKSIIRIILTFILVVLSILVVIKYREKIYQKNVDENTNIYNYKLVIKDETGNNVNSIREIFYEDKYYYYYFNGSRSNTLYAIINDNEKYLVKDLLNNNPSKYYITIEKLKEAGLEYIKESKYKELNIEGKGNGNSEINIENNKILAIDTGEATLMSSVNKEDTYFKKKYYIIPKKAGSTKVTIDFYNGSKYTFSKKYEIIIDNELNPTVIEMN